MGSNLISLLTDVEQQAELQSNTQQMTLLAELNTAAEGALENQRQIWCQKRWQTLLDIKKGVTFSFKRTKLNIKSMPQEYIIFKMLDGNRRSSCTGSCAARTQKKLIISLCMNRAEHQRATHLLKLKPCGEKGFRCRKSSKSGTSLTSSTTFCCTKQDRQRGQRRTDCSI